MASIQAMQETMQRILFRAIDFPRSRQIAAGFSLLLGYFVLKKASDKLSLRAHNNYVLDKTWDWEKELVVITGGCSGIGAKIVSMLAAKNVKVIIFDIIEPKSKLDSNCFFYKVDITSNVEIHTAAEQIRNQHGEPTVLINNAGFASTKPVLQVPESILRKVFDVNIISHFLLVKEFMPAMVAQNHGHIVTIASMASFLVQASNVDYGCTKAAALAFHEGLNQELKLLYHAPAVRTSVVHPSWVRTPMIEKLSSNPNFKDSIIEPEDVAKAIVDQLVSGRGTQIIIPRSGGWASSIRGFPLWLQEKLRTQISQIMLAGM